PVPGNDVVQPQQVLVDGLCSLARLQDKRREEQLFQLAVAGATGVLDRARGGLRTGVVPAALVLDLRDGLPECGEPRVVADLLEERSRFLGQRLELLEAPLGIGLRERSYLIDSRVQLAEPVARGSGALRRSGRARYGRGRVSCHEQRLRELQ